MMKNICAFVVTYNRLTLLKECIYGIRSQNLKPDLILVVNNGSTDGTKDWLNKQTDIVVLDLLNEGPANAFKTAFCYAIEHKYEWIWCMDDDTYPIENTLHSFQEFYLTLSPFERDRLGYMASEVLWIDGSICKSNVPWFKLGSTNEILASTFVSSVYKTKNIKEIGLPRKDFYQWYVDVEYTKRITNLYDAYYVAESKVIHKTVENISYTWENVSDGNFQKFAGGLTNHIFLIRTNAFNTTSFVKFKALVSTSLKAYYYMFKGTRNKLANFSKLTSSIIEGFKMNRIEDK